MKGEFSEECNITSCQKPKSAYYFNHSTRKYYCEECAKRLNNDPYNKKDSERLFGHDLCTPPTKLYSKHFDSYCYWNGIAYENDGKVSGAYFYGLEKAFNNSFIPVKE